jgi:molybdenum cofactor cytidylyltransferase
MNATAIILAAGASTRLNTPKQLIQFQGESLLRRTTRTVLGSRCHDVIVVTGAAAEVCTAELRGLPVRTKFNPLWSQGLSSSIRAGMAAVAAHSQLPDCVVLIVCDQPHLQIVQIDHLLEAHTVTGCGIVASRYSSTLGVPALFAAIYYPALASLQGDRGARNLFTQFENDCATVPFPLGAIDIDTPSDLAAALR